MHRCQGAPSTWAIAFLQALVRVRDNQLHAGEATLDQAAEEVTPERLRLALAAVDPDHLAPPRLVHAVRDHQALPHDAAASPDLLDLRIQPQIRIAALERPRTEGVDLLVESRADARDFRAGDPQAERLDQLIDLPRRHAAHVRLLDHRDECLLRAAPRLQKAREVGAAPDLRDRQLELAGARVPAPRPVAVAVRQPVWVALAMLGADQLRHLRLHQLPHHPTQRLAQEVEPLLALEQVADDLLSRHPLRLGHRGDSPLVVVLEDPTSLSTAVAGQSRLRPTRSYTTLWDTTCRGHSRASATTANQAVGRSSR